jgi:hypothetical protein
MHIQLPFEFTEAAIELCTPMWMFNITTLELRQHKSTVTDNVYTVLFPKVCHVTCHVGQKRRVVSCVTQAKSGDMET